MFSDDIAAVRAQQPAVHKHYLPGLDNLRAVAALSVCLFHYTNGALPKAIVPSVQQAFSKGVLGVVIFFVLSGFLIPYSLLGKNHQLSGFFLYIKKRIIRINPPAYAALLLIIIQWIIIDRFIQHSNAYTSGLSVGQIVSNVLFIVPFTSYKWLNGVFWTLAIEFEFYLFIGLLFSIMFERHHIRWFIVAYLLAAVVQYVVPALAVGSFFEYSAVFALGGTTLLWQQQRLTPALYVGCLLLFGGISFWQQGGYVAGTALATTLAINTIKVNVPGLGFIGKISYSLYLLHVLIGNVSEFVLVKLIPPTSVSAKLLITGLALVTAIIGSYIFYRLVEQPCMRLASKQR